MAKRVLVASLSAAPLALAACHSSDDLPSDPPKTVERVATGSFSSPMDAVAGLDGKQFYFSAFDDTKQGRPFADRQWEELPVRP